jgi:GNAT superfamily N-acetyltransferase
MNVTVTTVSSRRDLTRFIDLPHDVYRSDERYVPQLVTQQRELLDRRRSPFCRHSELELFLARWDGRVVGRIAAIHNRNHDRLHGVRQGFFGFFDCEDDGQAAAALLAACEKWHAGRGLSGLRGPVNPDLNHSCGILTEGFEHPPAFLMPYNAPYYQGLLEGAGLRICKRLLAWDIPSATIPEAAFAHAARLEEKLRAAGYVLRHLDRKTFAAEMTQLREVYNDSLSRSWGATPLTAEEFAALARGLRRICPPELIQIAEHAGRIVGFIGAAPDLNEILRGAPRGRLLPLGWARLLWRRGSIRGSRIVMYGVHHDHRHSGLATWLYLAIIRALRERGFTGAEASYVLEDNDPVNSISARLGGVCRKRYAILERPPA